MAFTLSLKSFEENAGMAAPGWPAALTGKNASRAVDSRRQRAEDVIVKGACRTPQHEMPDCDKDDRNLNAFAVGCDVRQRRAKMPPGQRAVDSRRLRAKDVLVKGACRTAPG